MTSSDLKTPPNDYEIVTTRVFEVPRSLAFKAWTTPEHIARWWGPNGFTTRIMSMDVTPGGVWRFVMCGPDGAEYHNRIVYEEVVEPERLVYRHEGDEECEPVDHHVTVTFAERGKQTEVSMRMVFSSAAALEHVVTKHGAVEGAKQTFQRLADHLLAIEVV